MNKKILGQEPAFLVGVVEAALAVFLTFGALGMDQKEAAAVVAAVNALLGLVVAYATSTTLYSAAMGLTKAILVLLAAWGLNLDDAKTGALMALISLVLSAYLRGHTDSLDTAISEASPGAKKEALELYALQAAVNKAAVQAGQTGQTSAAGVDA